MKPLEDLIREVVPPDYRITLSVYGFRGNPDTGQLYQGTFDKGVGLRYCVAVDPDPVEALRKALLQAQAPESVIAPPAPKAADAEIDDLLG